MAVFRTLPRRRKRSNFHTFALIFLYVFWSEFLALHLKALLWKMPEKLDDSIRLLLVADPQLIGYRHENKWIGSVSRWDSDRYMRRAFSKAYTAADPDFVLFMGDLFDEGVQMRSNIEEFEWTLQRFKSVFQMENRTNKVYIAGDNDIGGESEVTSPMLQDRFDRAFPVQLNGPKGKMFEFSQINLFDDGKVHKMADGKNLKLLLSHVPVIRAMQSVDQMFGNYRPDLIISAHDHTAEYYVKKTHSQQFTRHEAAKGLRFSISTGMPLVEIQVPTISYRMGVPNMAIGLLQISFEGGVGKAAVVEYENWWLPGRYPQLYGYLILLTLVLLYHFGSYLYPVAKLLRLDIVYRRFFVRTTHKYVPV
ncbi:Metallophos domain-containing protein [Aphelenchoides bicaudatus]|nr:Metallophos domain-containing protein [Aphelenchoides bicaudatus]